MTQYTPADLEMADRHIAEGADRIVRQAEILASLKLKGFPAADGDKLLVLFKETQQANRAHRDAIAFALEEAEQHGRDSPTTVHAW